MANFKKEKIGKDKNGNNVYNYRGFVIHKEYLCGEGYNWLAGDDNERYFNYVHFKPGTEHVMGNVDFGGSTYTFTLKETMELIDMIHDDDNIYLSKRPWPFDFSEKNPNKRNVVTEDIIDKSRFK